MYLRVPKLLQPGPYVGESSSLLDVIWKGAPTSDARHGMLLELHFTAGNPIRRAQYSIFLEKLNMRPLLRAIELYGEDDQRIARAEYVPQDDIRDVQSIPNFVMTGAGTECNLDIRGLVPAPAMQQPWAQLRAQLLLLRASTQWLHAGHRHQDRYLPVGDAPRRLSPDGRDAGLFLRTDPSIFAAVRSWYLEHFHRSLEIREVGRDFRVLLSPPRQPTMDIDLVDSGEGLHRVLPVLVGAELVKRGGIPRILVAEEPESNLHENAQRFLGAHLCKLAALDNPPQLVIETHSQALLLSVQLAVARGDLLPSKVQIYWVEAQEDGSAFAKSIELDRRGRPDGLPALTILSATTIC